MELLLKLIKHLLRLVILPDNLLTNIYIFKKNGLALTVLEATQSYKCLL